jgi:hypothetical protein
MAGHPRRVRGRLEVALALCLAGLAAVGVPARAQNLLANPNFDQGIFGWAPRPFASVPTWDASRDVDGSAASGSAELNGDGTAICQCVAHGVAPGVTWEFGGFGLFPTGEDAFQYLLFRLTVYPDPQCQLPPVGDYYSPRLGAPQLWAELRGQFTLPQGFTGSGMRFCGAVQGVGPQANVDGVFLRAVATGPCVPSATTLCLDRRRFAVTAVYEAPPSSPGAAHALPATDGSGFLWFFQANNLEVSVKVLDGCGLNERAWFFASGLTDAGVGITVTDTVTGVTKTYVNPSGVPFVSIQDTAAFAACP